METECRNEIKNNCNPGFPLFHPGMKETQPKIFFPKERIEKIKYSPSSGSTIFGDQALDAGGRAAAYVRAVGRTESKAVGRGVEVHAVGNDSAGESMRDVKRTNVPLVALISSDSALNAATGNASLS